MVKYGKDIAYDVKRQIASQLARQIKRQKISQTQLAKEMGTSRAVLHRLLKPDDVSVTLATISRVASILGLKVQIRLV